MIGRVCGVLLIITLISCGSTRHIRKVVDEGGLSKLSYTGICIYDLDSKKFIYQKDADKYFRPASNVKILTLYTCLKTLPDSLLAFKYISPDDSTVYIKGMADPTFLHPKFMEWQVDSFIRKYKYKFIERGNWVQDSYGKGWMWDDFGTDDGVPLSSMPVYGNSVTLTYYSIRGYNIEPENHDLQIQMKLDGEPKRAHLSNELKLPIEVPKLKSYVIPFHDPDAYLKKELGVEDAMDSLQYAAPWLDIKSTPIDTVLRYMMAESDNFLAEHLLLQCGALLNDTLSTSKTIAMASKLYFTGLAHLPKWVDGSGTSHYNLMCPDFTVSLLEKMWMEFDHERILNLQAIGGVSGTLKTLYKGENNKPYVFAKSGTLSNVIALSGFVVTDKGNHLAFSFMCNNFVGSNKPFRDEFGKLLVLMKEKF